MIGILLTEVAVIYIINGLHEKVMSLPNESENKINKKEEFHDGVMSLQRYKIKTFFTTR